ncbi:hypothetical protein [Paenibacillus daejeonensis]|uniref:hypothetical protein n=1 Tax=Paenibacillus daejeonensis TaxID=135193 RepID=UPI0003701699|nr:hypothetical protein [Paenibacillus daejeonensis]
MEIIRKTKLLGAEVTNIIRGDPGLASRIITINTIPLRSWRYQEQRRYLLFIKRLEDGNDEHHDLMGILMIDFHG